MSDAYRKPLLKHFLIQIFRSNIASVNHSVAKKVSRIEQVKILIFDNAQVKLTIVVCVFIVCYLPYATLLIVDSFIYVSPLTVYITDILAYSASMWNPVLILILNYKFFR